PTDGGLGTFSTPGVYGRFQIHTANHSSFPAFSVFGFDHRLALQSADRIVVWSFGREFSQPAEESQWCPPSFFPSLGHWFGLELSLTRLGQSRKRRCSRRQCPAVQ